MAGLRGRLTLQPTRAQCLPRPLLSSRAYSSSRDPISQNIASMLAMPNWSVQSLLLDKTKSSTLPVNSEKLQHLLRLSALPQPASQSEETAMLRTLESQVHFVKEIQRVDTTGIKPLQSIRDESVQALNECSIGLDSLKEVMAKERVTGRRRRIQRIQSTKSDLPDAMAWDGNALGSASNTMGKFFVVKSWD
jgi:Asp-tRNA(Asn)/Glu-tRNA(Gln) amidotransferase C subunit